MNVVYQIGPAHFKAVRMALRQSELYIGPQHIHVEFAKTLNLISLDTGTKFNLSVFIRDSVQKMILNSTVTVTLLCTL